MTTSTSGDQKRKQEGEGGRRCMMNGDNKKEIN